jgi:hypothetical protein
MGEAASASATRAGNCLSPERSSKGDLSTRDASAKGAAGNNDRNRAQLMALFFFMGFCSILLGVVVFIMVATKFKLILAIPAALSAAYLAYLAAHSIFGVARAA